MFLIKKTFKSYICTQLKQTYHDVFKNFCTFEHSGYNR